ncbi:MAG: sulfite exporter TauE/SafE family protein [Rhodospirillales bacterium]|nr:sulfite exporter TauE/SafE family protein [Alphaproteobacteria bacterium]MCB1840325.1 sulfite exporter TauE/SafE family protein [Alphaproteobacteria bacterium]MCB9976978.1 sulfite exporter TauE/SafE family protein [Rhodospirillales bacterium]
MSALANLDVLDLVLLIACLLLLGCVSGYLAGLLGVGGGIVLVPGLHFIFESLSEKFGFSTENLMHVCIGTSLAIIVPTGWSSARAHHKRGGVDLDIVKRLGLGIVIGVVLATAVAKDLSGTSLKMIFATAILFLSFLMIADHEKFKLGNELPKQPVTGLAGFVIGVLSALIGIGGATLSVPYMSMYGVPIRRAVGSASAMGLVISIPAAIGYIYIGLGQEGLPPFSLGYVNFLAWLCVIPSSMLMAPFGAKTAHNVSVKRLKIIFSVFMMIVALNMWRKILMP